MSIRAAVVTIVLLAGSQIQQVPGVVVSYSGQMSFVQHEPVALTLTLRNISRDPVNVDLGFNRTAGLAIEVETPDNRRVRPTLAATGLGRVGRITIAPGEEYSQSLLLNEWFPFEDVGTYHVNLELTGAITSPKGPSLGRPGQDTLIVQIAPRNEALLVATCRHLSATIMNSDRAEERMEAARALSYVNDRAAVPLIREVLQATEVVDWILIEGLRKLGTADARQLMQELAQSSSRERSAMARSILQSWPITRVR